MKIATVSLNQVWEDKEINLSLCVEYTKEASLKGVELIIFPEMTLTGFSTNIKYTVEDPQKSETIAKFQTVAKEHNIAILFGVVAKDGEKALNKSIFVDSNGKTVGEYAKIHPFSFSGEDKYFNAGDKLTIVKYKDLKISLSICYDLRFPEIYSAMAKECDMIVNIANWPKKRVDHWRALLKARAIENQLYIIGVNRTGIDGNSLEYEESSMVYNANGEAMDFETFKAMKIFDIDKQYTEDFRKSFNTINDRRVELYKEIL